MAFWQRDPSKAMLQSDDLSDDEIVWSYGIRYPESFFPELQPKKSAPPQPPHVAAQLPPASPPVVDLQIEDLQIIDHLIVDPPSVAVSTTEADSIQNPLPSKSLDNLPDELLLPIFKLLPLGCRFHLGLVSRRWYRLLEDTISKEGAILLGGKRYAKWAKGNDLVFYNGTNSSNSVEDALQRLLSKFTSLTELTIYLDDQTWVGALAAVLTNQDLQLHTLLVHCCKTRWRDTSRQLSTRLAAGINAQSSLVRLHFYNACDGDLHFAAALWPTTLSRLQRFTLLSDPLSPQLTTVISARIAENISASLTPTCTHLALSSRHFDWSSKYSQESSPALVQLKVLQSYVNLAPRLNQRFPLLQSLHLDFESASNTSYLDSALLSHLSAQKHLTSLVLKDLEMNRNLVHPQAGVQSCAKVEHLSLVKICFNGNGLRSDWFLQALLAWFPNLKYLVITWRHGIFAGAPFDLQEAIEKNRSRLLYSIKVTCLKVA